MSFSSHASNLVDDDTNDLSDVFVYDRQTNQIGRVSVASGGAQENSICSSPSISADGRYVAFECWHFLEDPDVFIHDRQTIQTILVSVASDGTPGNDWSRRPALSANGRFVAFESDSTNLVDGDTNNFCYDSHPDGSCPDIFVHDRQTGQTTRVSVSSTGVQGNAKSLGPPSISADGRYVTFQSFASNLVPNDTNGDPDIFVHDRQTGQTTRVSVNPDGTQINNWSATPAISANGRYVAFLSLVAPAPAGGGVFVHDQQTGQTILIAQWATGGLGSNNEPNISLSADGRYVVYENINGGQVYLYDQQTTQTTLISAAPDGSQGNSYSDDLSISADGRYVAFASNATNLVNGDTNGYFDVFVRDRGAEPQISYTVSGQLIAYEDTVVNGNVTQISHPLGYAAVTVLNQTKGTSTTVVSTSAGNYNATIDANIGDSLSVRAELIYRRGITDYLQIQYGSVVTSPVVSIETQHFTTTSTTSIQRDMFFDGTLSYIIPDGVPSDDLDDTALMYHHFQEALDFTLDELNVTLNYELPIGVRAFDNGINADSGGYVTNTASIRFGTNVSLSTFPGRPMNREWHEYFHHVMQDTIGLPTRVNGDENHGGFLNFNTADSWAEGWAEFWTMMLAEHLGLEHPWIYADQGSFEQNLTAWHLLGQTSSGNWQSAEDFGVASLLWDLHDSNNPVASLIDSDHMSLSATQLWTVLVKQNPDGTFQPLSNIRQVYNAFITDLPSEQSKIDEIFEAHGFFGDKGWVIQNRVPIQFGNQRRADEEGIGFGGREGRSNAPYFDGGFLLVNLQNQTGEAVDNGALVISVEYESPDDIYDYTYEYPLFSGNANMVYLPAPWTDYTATVTVQALNSSTPPYLVGNQDFWNMIPNSGQDYVAEKTFVIEHNKVYLPLILK